MGLSNYPGGFREDVLIRNQRLSHNAPGKVFWVGNSATLLPNEKAASDATNKGTYLEPYSTLDYAIGQCSADRGDIIYVRPNHTITVTAADGVDADVAGISIIGLGNGTNRPRVDYTGASGEFVIGADNVTIDNLNFHANVTTVVKAINVEADVDFATIRNCVFDVETTGTDEFNNAIILVDGNVGCVIEDCYFDMGIGAAVRAIYLDADTDNLIIRNNIIHGDYSTANIGGDTTLSTNLVIDNNILVNGDASDLGTVAVISLLTGTTGYIRNNLCVCNVATPDLSIVADTCILSGNRYSETITGADEPLYAEKVPDSTYNFIGVDDSNNVASTSNVADNRDGSLLERTETIIAALLDDVATNFIGVDDANNVAATTNVVANLDGSILERLEALMDPLGGYDPVLGFRVTKTSNLADGSGTDNLFTVTGRCLITHLSGEVTTVIGGAATMKLRDVTNSVDLCAATTIDSDAVGTMYSLPGLTAEILNGTGGTPVIGSVPNVTTPSGDARVIIGDVQAALTIAHVLDAADTGAVAWVLYYKPLTASSSIVAAA